MSNSPFIPGFALVLASQSPRRSELLKQAGIPFSIRPSHIPEMVMESESARGYVARVASAKAAAIVSAEGEGVLAADTTVAILINGTERIFEKPQDANDAKAMLQLLSGRTHIVYTGISFCWEGREWKHVEQTSVEFAEMTEHEVNAYVNSHEPLDKAGAYGIQGLASKFVSRIDGCFYNVVGLPIHQVCKIFKAAGVIARDESPLLAF